MLNSGPGKGEGHGDWDGMASNFYVRQVEDRQAGSAGPGKIRRGSPWLDSFALLSSSSIFVAIITINSQCN